MFDEEEMKKQKGDNANGLSKYDLALEEMKAKNPDFEKAEALLRSALKKGNAKATYALVTWYLHGANGLEMHLGKAVELLEKAAKQGNSDAMYDLAVCYEEGKGVAMNSDQAFELYLRAAIRGDAQSLYEVGRCYYHGIGTHKDKSLAAIWLERGEELGVD